MPELAALYSLGVVCSALLGALLWYLTGRMRHSPEMLRLNERLHRIGWHWSDTQSRFVAWDDERAQAIEDEDKKNRIRTVVALTVLGCFTSWAGFVFMLIIIFSMQVLARPRLERRVFVSELVAEAKLADERVRALMHELDPSTLEDQKKEDQKKSEA